MVVYEPRMSRSLLRAVPMREVDRWSKVSVCDQGEATRRLAISSPETRRSCSPPDSSVLSISDKAVPSHASSVLPERLWNPRTATDLRVRVGGADVPAAASALERELRRFNQMPMATRTIRAGTEYKKRL